MSSHGRRVTFNLPAHHNDAPPGILRQPTRRNLPDPSLPVRRSSLPIMGDSRMYSRESRLKGLEALQALRNYLKDACNFHGESMRRAISVPSIDALSSLISYVNVLRNVSNTPFTKRDETYLRSLIDCTSRHPHEQLAPDQPAHANVYELYAKRAHRKRARREADHHLLYFVARELRLPPRLVRELSRPQRIQRELDAFRAKIKKFNDPSMTRPPTGNNSTPNSPADRVMTTAVEPHTDPLAVQRAYDMPGAVHDLFPPDLRLPTTRFDQPAHQPPPRSSAYSATPIPPRVQPVETYATGGQHAPAPPPTQPMAHPHYPQPQYAAASHAHAHVQPHVQPHGQPPARSASYNQLPRAGSYGTLPQHTQLPRTGSYGTLASYGQTTYGSAPATPPQQGMASPYVHATPPTSVAPSPYVHATPPTNVAPSPYGTPQYGYNYGPYGATAAQTGGMAVQTGGIPPARYPKTPPQRPVDMPSNVGGRNGHGGGGGGGYV